MCGEYGISSSSDIVVSILGPEMARGDEARRVTAHARCSDGNYERLLLMMRYETSMERSTFCLGILADGVAPLQETAPGTERMVRSMCMMHHGGALT